MADYPGANTFPDQVRIPNDGEYRNMTEFGAAFEDLTDRTKYLQIRQPGGSTTAVRCPVSLKSALGLGESGWNWAQPPTGFPWYISGNSTTLTTSPAKSLYLSLDEAIPSYGRISSIGVRVIGPNHSSMPAAKPRLSLITIDQFSSTWPNDWTEDGEVFDASANTTAYSLPHVIVSHLETPVTISPGINDYCICLINENGANALGGLIVMRAWVEVVA